MKKIKVKFINNNINDYYKEGIVGEDLKNLQLILNSEYEFNYKKSTNIRELFSDIYIKLFNFQIDDNSLTRTFRYIYNNEETLIYNFDTKIDDFLKGLSIKNNTIEILFKYCFGLGGVILRENGIKYKMNSNEDGKHNIPHVHVEFKNKKISINILNGEILAGNINSKINNIAIKRVLKNKNEFLLAWNTKTNGRKLELFEEDLEEFERIRVEGT